MPSESVPASASAGPSKALLAVAQNLIDNSEIVDVRPVRIIAAFEEGGSPGVRIETASIEVASGYVNQPGVFSNKFEFRILLSGEDERPVARFEYDLVVDYRVPEDFEVDSEAADFVTGTTGYFAAYPYAREMLHSMSARLRLDPVVLGFLKKRPDGRVETMEIGTLRRPERRG